MIQVIPFIFCLVLIPQTKWMNFLINVMFFNIIINMVLILINTILILKGWI